MVRTFGGHIRANGIRQHFIRLGQQTDRPLLIVPGISSPAATWLNVGRSLSAVSDVIILDVRGRGLSESGPSLDYSLDACADDLVAFVAALGCGSIDILGHSMGGRIALRAQRRIGNIRHLVLVDPPVSGPNHPMRVKDLNAYLEVLSLAKAGISAHSLRRYAPHLSDADLMLRAEWLPTCDEKAIEAAHKGFVSDDFWQDLAGLTIPMLLMAAGDHALITVEDIEAFNAVVPDARTAIIDSGHMIPMENWPDFYRELAAFLDLPSAIPPYHS